VGVAKVAISLDERALERVDRLVEGKFPNRSRLIQDAIAEKLERTGKTRLAAECAKLDPDFERAFADEGLSEAAALWPEYRGAIPPGPTSTKLSASDHPATRSGHPLQVPPATS
jgi:Arc/MetJ-type ribon-helix-helix transcriptional regulator